MSVSTMNNRQILLVGATGTVGSLVLHELISRQAAVRVLVRQPRPEGDFPAGVTQVVADLGDETAVRSALRGVDAALYISPHEQGEETYAQIFVRAARDTRTRIVFTGVHAPARTPLEWLQRKLFHQLLPSYRAKFRIGELIAASGNAVIFGPTNFYQNDEVFLDDIGAGLYPMPLRRANRVDVRDVAELAAAALLDPAHPAGEHLIAGPSSYSGRQCAAVWSAALGRVVSYVGDDATRWQPIYRNRLHGKKLTDWSNTANFLGRRSVVLPRATADTTRLLGRAPRSYETYVAEQAEKLRRRIAGPLTENPMTPGSITSDQRLTRS